MESTPPPGAPDTDSGDSPGNESATDPHRTSSERQSRIWARLKRLFFEAAKFGAVGGVAFLVDNGAYFLLVNGPGQVMAGFPVRASVVASAVATVVSYLGNRYWTFSKRRDRGPSDGTRGTPVREFVAYVIANVIGIMITGGCLYFSRWMLDFHTAAADAVARNVGIALGTVFRYLAYKFWVFTGPPKETP